MDAATLFVAVLLSAAPVAERGLAESNNFIVNAPHQKLADEVVERAETLRGDLARRWLGESLTDGDGRAILHLNLAQDTEKALTWPKDDQRRKFHLVWLTSNETLLTGPTLAHELTHVVLATRYGKHMPVWANEGAAGLEDEREIAAIRRRWLERFSESGRWPSVEEVLAAQSLSPSDQVRYTVAVSLTEYLLTRGSSQEFIQFALDGAKQGWNSALEQHYGIADTRQLTAGWQAWVAEELRGGQRNSQIRTATPARPTLR